MNKWFTWTVCLGLALGCLGCGDKKEGGKSSTSSTKDSPRDKGNDASMKDAGLGK